MDNASYQAGQAKGQAQEKGNQLLDKAGNAAQSVKESCQNAGQQAQAKAQGAVDAVKDAVNSNKIEPISAKKRLRHSAEWRGLERYVAESRLGRVGGEDVPLSLWKDHRHGTWPSGMRWNVTRPRETFLENSRSETQPSVKVQLSLSNQVARDVTPLGRVVWPGEICRRVYSVEWKGKTQHLASRKIIIPGLGREECGGTLLGQVKLSAQF
ncbi:stress-induced protein KIN1-like [Salvia divinorum]|uniref:Stress-induced protein KIN1-like n=1 Tax=Salvia divinorum TaxID=28513 RepID=A0ABD1I996_SALDI